tara:strand:- start:1313 stop:1774 length:462 start_codon:yes stop_codon:yes gene_type:complete
MTVGSSNKGSGCLIAVLASVMGFALFVVSFFYWANWLHRHPSDAAASTHISSLTGETLPETANIILAQRSSSDLFGDFSGCYIVELSEADFEDFLSRFESTENPNMLTGCPAASAQLGSFNGEFRGTIEENYDLVLIYYDRSKFQILIKFFYF